MNGVVIIAEKRILREDINMYSNELDFSSREVTERILEAFESQQIPTYYYDSPRAFLNHITQHKNDVVFATMWGGPHSRNKRSLIAAICESYGICYVGADTFVQSLCQDKYLTKHFLRDFSFQIPKAILISSEKDMKLLERFSYFPCIVKPNDEGCSVGISDHSNVNCLEDAQKSVQTLLAHYSPVLVEQFIPGIEVSVCCVGNGENLDIFEAVQLVIDGKDELSKPWGYESKKTGKSVVSRKIITKDFPQDILAECKRLFSALGKVDLMRIDGKLYQNRFYIIELSPDCSLHQTCFMSTAFAHNNFSYDQMLMHLAQSSWNRFHSNKTSES